MHLYRYRMYTRTQCTEAAKKIGHIYRAPVIKPPFPILMFGIQLISALADLILM